MRSGSLGSAGTKCASATALLFPLRGFYTGENRRRGVDVTQDEAKHLLQDLPPPSRMLRPTRKGAQDGVPGNVQSEAITIPGDTFGLLRNRSAFLKPMPRPTPQNVDPRCCVNPVIQRRFCSAHGVDSAAFIDSWVRHGGELNAMLRQHYHGDDREADHNHNSKAEGGATRAGSQEAATAPFGTYALTALEHYAPETFCLVNYSLPSHESCRDEEVLEAIHELTLSAAELPLDLPRDECLSKFRNEWTTESGERCGDVMEQHGIAATDLLLLPCGEYSAHGFYVLHPLTDIGFPNIGSGAAACALDLRTGIHNRFRFHVERMADTICEHVLQEALHVGQDDVHILRQAFWFNAEYSVEEFLRFKESLLQPSASIFEVRYACMMASNYARTSYRNLVELEKLKVAQHKHEKHYETYSGPGSWITSDHSQLQTAGAAGGGANSSGSVLFSETNHAPSATSSFETRTAGVQRVMERSVLNHGDYFFGRFYRNNFH